jgi:hypothetical protein
VNEPAWATEREFQDSQGNWIRILERTLTDLNQAKQKELLPFFREVSLFQLSFLGGPREEQRVVGTLVDLAVGSGSLQVRILSRDKKEQSLWSIQSAAHALLTVWRVNQQLDALQTEVTGAGSRLYMQTGGERLLYLFDAQAQGIAWSQELADAVRLFSRNAAP